jgi:hypothetical protein
MSKGARGRPKRTRRGRPTSKPGLEPDVRPQTVKVKVTAKVYYNTKTKKVVKKRGKEDTDVVAIFLRSREKEGKRIIVKRGNQIREPTQRELFHFKRENPHLTILKKEVSEGKAVYYAKEKGK